MRFVYRLTSISLLLLFTLTVSSGSAAIRGIVLDASGKSIPGARIVCAGKIATSGADGRFTGYHLVGYVAVAAGLLSMALAGRVRVRDAR